MPFSPTEIFRRPVLRALIFLLAWILPWVTGAQAASVPQRIISMSPSITEILFELGAGDRVVGVTDFCAYPESACRLPKIGGLLNPNLEMWLTLRPDLIIYQAGSEKIASDTRNLKIPSLAVNMKSLESVFDSIHKMGSALGIESRARDLVARLKSGLQGYRERLAGAPPKTVLLILSDTTTPGRDLYAVSSGTFLGQLLEIAGGDNIVQDTIADYPKVSREYILHRSPEIIIEAGPRSNPDPEQKRRKIREWSRLPTLRAVRTENIHFVGADYILIPGPRLLRIVDQFARILHPDRFLSDPTPGDIHP